MVKTIEHYRKQAAKYHPLHFWLGNIFDDLLTDDFRLIRDKDCGGDQKIPLFIDKEKSRKTQLCYVDLLIIHNNKIHSVIEVEESDGKPTQVCGKFLTTALSNYYIHKKENNKPIPMGEDVLFFQFVDTSGLKRDRTSKNEQWKNIEKTINEILPLKNSSIKHYKMFDINVKDLESKRKEIENYFQ